MLAQLGVRVTMVELLRDIMAVVDADVRRELRRHMEKTLGIRILTGVTLEEITADDRGVRGRAGQESLEADLLLVSLGRKPVTSSLKLENAGLTPNERGFLDVDAYGRTSVATIYAVGDVTGGPLLAHAATAQGLVAAENACGRYLHKNETLVPNCIFTTPEIGTVGLGEQEAQQQGRKIKTGKYLFGALGKALAIGEPIGFCEVGGGCGDGSTAGSACRRSPRYGHHCGSGGGDSRGIDRRGPCPHHPRPSHPGRSLDGSRPRPDGRAHSLRATAQSIVGGLVLALPESLARWNGKSEVGRQSAKVKAVRSNGEDSSAYASMRRSPFGSGMGSPNSRAVSIHNCMASLA